MLTKALCLLYTTFVGLIPLSLQQPILRDKGIVSLSCNYQLQGEL